MDAVFYSIAFGHSEMSALQLAASVQSLRMLDARTPVYIFFFGTPPAGFLEVINRFNVDTHDLGNYRQYFLEIQPDYGEVFALDPKIHRWLVLNEPVLKACSRLLYVDSDTIFLQPASEIFERYTAAEFYAREEPFCRRSTLGYDSAYVDEDQIAELQMRERLNSIAPFNTGVFLSSREAADAITSVLPYYFDYLLRLLSFLHADRGPIPNSVNSSIQAIYDDRFRPDTNRALPLPSRNSWIIDQIAMWLALGKLDTFHYEDFDAIDVWQGAEFRQASEFTCSPMLIHYFSSNYQDVFPWLQRWPLNPFREH